MYSYEEECCGNCGNKRYENGEWVCGCEASEMYGLDTSYGDSCEEWCEG